VRWDAIAKVHQMAFIRRLSLWLLVLPLLAELLGSAAAKQLKLETQLPFSWGLLYLAAAIFLISTLIYSFRCPEIIRDYRGWYEYREREGSYEKLIPLVFRVARTLNSGRRYQFLHRQFYLSYITPINDGGKIPPEKWKELSENLPELKEALLHSTTNKESIPDVYAATREVAQTTRGLARYSILILHATAAICIVIVALQNSSSVVEHYFPRLIPTVFSQWR
jgi:hypothetical protein